jgi:hypothetical protein
MRSIGIVPSRIAAIIVSTSNRNGSWVMICSSVSWYFVSSIRLSSGINWSIISYWLRSWDCCVGDWLLDLSVGDWLLDLSVGNWLLDLSVGNWVFNILGGLHFQRLLGVMDNLSFNWDVFVSDVLLGNLDVINSLFRDILRNVLSKILYSIVVSDSHLFGDGLDFSFFSIFNFFDFLWYSFNLSLILIFNNLLFKGNIFNSALSFDYLFACVDSCANDMAIRNNGAGRIVVGGSGWDIGSVGGGDVGGGWAIGGGGGGWGGDVV